MRYKPIRYILMGLGVFLVGAGVMLLSIPNTVNAQQDETAKGFTDTECLVCHTDQARLQQLTENDATETTEEESLSSGPG